MTADRSQPSASDSSCPALCRASTSFFVGASKDVDGRDKPGHDDVEMSVPTFVGTDACCAGIGGGGRRSENLS
jgi:hypothetical protein